MKHKEFSNTGLYGKGVSYYNSYDIYFILLQTEYCHMLNATMCAVTRVICVLMETNQTDTGIRMPAALRPWLPPDIQDEIPFIRPPLPREADQPKQKKGKQ